MVGGHWVGCGIMICEWFIGRQCVSGPGLNRGGCQLIHLKQTEFSAPQVIIAVWRVILPVGGVWRVVGGVIVVARISNGENGSGDSDDD